ncbi:S1C family serine protease [Subtercola endophyticus]|uniref:S1C family serine protease n=1 Tax=Subtercola endophyticus TaxID=2895559 RepID=UPI001E4DB0C5|nr:trypsin-like peptidase domain-containing protein [Subtercola endophyticus]UFS59975.1 trypsin-like peptidase domain-containing protein [Subtercola endophyticus]
MSTSDSAGPDPERPAVTDSSATPVPETPVPETPLPETPVSERPVPVATPDHRRTLVIGLAILAALVIAVGGGVVGAFAANAGHTGSSCDAVSIADRVLPAVVTVSVQGGGASGASGNGVGTGEILTSDGYIVTNNHVISSAATSGTISVLYSSGESAPATLVGRDPVSDLAVLKVSPDRALPTIAVGDSAKIDVGQPVVALGAPLGLSNTVTAGIVSALDRNVQAPSDNNTTTTLVGAIQTDAAINPGNSGGALVDCSGALIGVNTAIASVPNSAGQAGGGSVGIGFAVPVNLMNTIVDQLKTKGAALYPWFGVDVTPIPAATAQRFGVAPGLFVESVVSGGPVAAAGIRPGDIVTQIDGSPATGNDVITRITQIKSIGDTIAVTYVRGGTSTDTTVTLGTPPS